MARRRLLAFLIAGVMALFGALEVGASEPPSRGDGGDTHEISKPKCKKKKCRKKRGGGGRSVNCHSSYPDFCIPPPPPDLDCADIGRSYFTVVGSDPHGFDGDGDGIGCES